MMQYPVDSKLIYEGIKIQIKEERMENLALL